MLKVNTKIVGQKAFLKRLKNVEHLNYAEVAEIIRAKMLNVIDTKRVRDIKQPEERFEGKYKEHLSDSIQVKLGPKGFVVGEKTEMQRLTPYWKVVNDGGYVPPPTHGVFTGGAGSSLFHTSDGPLITPTKPIPAMRYIEETAAWVKTHLKRFIKGKVVKALKDRRQNAMIGVK